MTAMIGRQMVRREGQLRELLQENVRHLYARLAYSTHYTHLNALYITFSYIMATWGQVILCRRTDAGHHVRIRYVA